MYTFNPIADIPVDHGGFIVIAVLFTIIWMILMYHSRDEDFNPLVCTLLVAIIPVFAYFVSYHWSDQNTKTFTNTQFTGEFVGFNPEAYAEYRTSGKTTRLVDVHLMYVTYKVNGNLVMFRANTGLEYPKFAVLYKN